MRKCRKMISVIMLMVMLVSLLPSGALAAEAPTGATNEVAAVEEPTEVEPATGETEETLPAETKTDGTENEGDNETTITEGTSEGASVSDGTEGTGEATNGGTNEAASVEEPSENSSGSATEAAGIGETSVEIAPVVEPVEKEAKDAGETNLYDYVVTQNGGTVKLILVDKNNNVLQQNSNGEYDVYTANNPYKLTFQAQVKKFAPGVYTYQFPKLFTYSLGDANPKIVLNGKEIATYEITSDGLLTATFNEEANNAQDITTSFTFDINFGGTDNSLEKIGDITVRIHQPGTGVPSFEKVGVSVSGSTLNWRTAVTCDEKANAVGLKVTDAVDTTNKHYFTQADQDKGVTVTASHGSDSVSWKLTKNGNGFEWVNKTGWTYTIPESYNGKTFGPGWDFTFSYSTTIETIDNTRIVGYRNWAYFYDNNTLIKRDDAVIERKAGQGHVDKTGSFGGENGQKEYIEWTISAYINNLAPTDVFNFADVMLIYPKGYKGHEDPFPLTKDKFPEMQDFNATITFTDNTGKRVTENLPVRMKGSTDTSTSPSGYYLYTTGIGQSTENWIDITSPKPRFYVYNENVEKGSGFSGRGEIKLSYKTKLTTEYLKIIEDNQIVATNNSVWLYRNSAYLDFARAWLYFQRNKKETTHFPAKANNDNYKASFQINYTPADEDVDKYDNILIEDTMSNTLSYVPKSAKVTAKDNNGNLLENINFTETYENHVLTIKIIDPKRYDYVITYDAFTSNNPQDAIADGTIPFNNEFSAVVNGEKTNVIETSGKLSDWDGNAHQYSVTINKVDDTNKPLAGAKFAAYLEDGTLAFKPKTTNAQGKVTFTTSVDDDIMYIQNTPYYIQETEAPARYKLNTKKYWFVVLDTNFPHPENADTEEYWKDYFENTVGAKEGEYKIIKPTYTNGSSSTGSIDFTVENKSEDIQLTVNKKWDDANNANSTRPASISIQLKADDVNEGSAVTVTAEDNWSHTWKNLKKYNAKGELIKYTVSEETVPGYENPVIGEPKEVKDKDGNVTGYTIEITNKLTPKTQVSVKKVWDDFNNDAKKRPASITVQLLADGKVVTGSQVTLDGKVDDTEKTAWEYTWEDLDKYGSDGKTEIKYTVDEVSVPGGYTKTINGNATTGYTINNSYMPKVNIAVEKIWDDSNDQDGLRPTSITVKLLADGKEVEGEGSQVILDGKVDDKEKEVWKYTWENLDKFSKETNAEIKYTVDEVSVPKDYTKTISGDATVGYKIKNTHSGVVTQVSVEKVWDDNNDQDGIRPESITVKLLADGKEVEGSQVTLDGKVDNKEKEAWKYTWENLPKKKAGVEIKYTVDEVSVPKDYTKSISGDATVGYKIKNTHTPVPTSVSVEKVWDDSNDQDGLRPTSITVKLLADGKEVEGSQVTLDGKVDNKEKEAWKYTWENLPKKKAGVEIKYTVDEVSVPKDYTKSISGDATVGYKIKNTHRKDTTEVSVKKDWADHNDQDEARPESITVQLLADGKIVEGSQVTLDGKIDDKEKAAWNYTWENLDKNKDGVEIKYTVDEVSVPEGYTKSISGDAKTGYTITNTHKERKVSISKVDATSMKEVKGAQIQLIDAKGNVVDKWTSTDDGKPHVVHGLTPGAKYTLHETVEPLGYTIASDTTFSVDAEGKVTSSGTVTEGNVVLVEDSMTKVNVKKVDAANDKELPGATLQILDSNGNVVTVKDHEGNDVKCEWVSTEEDHVVEGLTAGVEYTLRETITPPGFTITSDTKFTIDNNNKVTSDGTVSKTNDGTPVLVVKDNMTVVEVSKVAITGEKELKGANIQILDDKGNIVTVKDHEGNDVKCEWVSTGKPHKVEGLEINKTYTLHETIQPDGYTIATDATFSIDKDNNVKYSGKKNDSGVLLIEDKPTKVKISKTDVAHEKELQGATLQILDSEGNVVEIKDNDGKVVEKCEWASGKEPKYIEGLKTNVVYTLRETIAPNGYTIATDIQFTIKDDGKVESTGKTIKAEETEDGVEVLLVEDEPTKLYVSKQAVTGDEELPGATLQILDEKENVVVLKDNDGNPVETLEWKSGEEPKYIEGLPTGVNYILRETISPDGYTIASDTKFSIDENGVVTSDGTTSTAEDGTTVLVVKDDFTTVQISKVDTESGAELEGAKLQIIDEDNNIVEEWTSTKEVHVVRGLVANKKYILRETVAPLGYTLTTDTTFSIDMHNVVTSTGPVNKDGVILVNDTMTEVEILKVDSKTGKGLAGAKLQVLDDNGAVCDEWKSTKDAHKIRGLYTGVKYTLHEVEAPKGYDKAKDITFTIDTAGKVSSDALDNGKIVMKDTPTPKKNKTGDEANGSLWALLLMMASGALGGTVWFKRKRRA